MNTPLHEFEKLFQRVLDEVRPEDQKCQLLLKIFHDIVLSLSEKSALHFNTLFARVSYLTSRFQMSRNWVYAFQIVRKELKERNLSDKDLIPILEATIVYLLSIYQNEEGGRNGIIIIPRLPDLPPARSTGRFKKTFARVSVIEWDKEKKLLRGIDEDTPDSSCIINYCVAGVNDIYSDTLELAIHEMGLPLVLGLADIETTEDLYYIPSYIIILPDLLIDVTSIAQSQPTQADPLSINVIELFLPSESNESIMTGQVANYFLDELIRDTTLDYSALFTKSFKIFPIEFVQLTDDKLKSMYAGMQSHFDNIRNAIDDRFPGVGIDRKQCVIEPSYFSPRYGIKGRLDLYYHHESEQSASIVELKSGRPFKPNSYGLSSANYHQTLLYELLIKSVHGPRHHRANFILYSSSATDTLRYAVSVESLQKETIHNRNGLVLLQFRMMQLDQPGARDIMEEIKADLHPAIKGYIKSNIQNWEKTYSALSPGEKSYCKFFTAFITREHMLARIGSDSSDGNSGLASLWLDKMELKEEKYQVLQGLELMKLETSDHQTILRFRRSELTNPLANFRAGDIAIMYPCRSDEPDDPTRYQLYRANVNMVNANEVIIKLRNNQVHVDQIMSVRKWNLEHDLLDSSFRSLYQSLWSFLSADIRKRQLILGLVKPAFLGGVRDRPHPGGLTSRQLTIYNEALNAESIYLLWGPPGTGKTSRMLKSWVWYYFFHTDARIALLAYTNRAVDEICEALSDLGPEVSAHFLRIGSRAGTGETFRCRLLDNVIEPMSTRKEIKDLLESTRIFVATIASIQGKSEIFRLINFDVAIIDEASQILEPSMAGLMVKFPKTILIGDHKQLPAVSAQPPHLTRIKPENEWGGRIGLTDMGMSYFERIFRLYERNRWNHIIGLLTEQGRMHKDIQIFANQYVYGGQLTCLDETNQGEPLQELTRDTEHPLFNERLIYIPVHSSLRENYLKTNEAEAIHAVEIIAQWQEKMLERDMDWTIGVITPFRAQVAAILHKAHQRGLKMDNVTVDTVERYQGGARDIVIMSASVNNRNFLSRIVSRNEDGIDRKLNVAVTRARQQFILLGNRSILAEEEGYRKLIAMSCAVHMDAILNHNPAA